jgi:hypothetical protein
MWRKGAFYLGTNEEHKGKMQIMRKKPALACRGHSRSFAARSMAVLR